MLGVVQTAEWLPTYREVFDGNAAETRPPLPTLTHQGARTLPVGAAAGADGSAGAAQPGQSRSFEGPATGQRQTAQVHRRGAGRGSGTERVHRLGRTLPRRPMRRR